MIPTATQSIPRPSDEMPIAELSPNSSSTSNARLTPDSDSESDSDLDIGEGELGEGFKLQNRGSDVEKGSAADDDELEEGYRDAGPRRGSASTVHSFQLYTPDEERAVVRKFDRKLVLFVALLYMLSFLDRSSLSPPLLSKNHSHS